ncbi:hypothetical protein K227x_39880 [Rubripirellula lacrimiformis]|uniref:AAA+ ATPase domain-containing protein n=1 Tax=Rubripirellula lacrimiformis TaxID=1930273 RepID=A0A517NEN1_9BACT|nr:AAA family ATPase [Rubripirellula lacrimiformis]QDT05587.1 hypothetical protein K227x_39880 [Rubripirellula lacrimiformis]
MQSSNSTYNVPPFPAFPSVSRYVALGSIEDAVTRVGRSIDAQEAISLVIGPPGTGKSLICNLLVKRYQKTHDVVVLGDTTIEDRAAFLRHLLHHLGCEYARTPDNDLHLALVDRVCGPDASDRGLLIVVDEAQSLAREVLESIRMVTNIMRSGQPRVTAVVCGGMKLDEVLIDPSLESFVQRVSTRCYLHPMNSQETRCYIQETIRHCGAEPDQTISDEAIAAIHHAASGVPRLVNQMMTQAIDCAEESDESVITEAVVDRAWATLQQLPSPMIEEPALKSANAGSPIEFGELSSLESSQPAQPVPCDSSDESDDCNWEEPGGEVDDIRVEPATAMWVDESDAGADATLESEPDECDAAALLRTTPLPAALFGDFEIEEDVDLNAVAASAHNASFGDGCSNDDLAGRSVDHACSVEMEATAPSVPAAHIPAAAPAAATSEAAKSVHQPAAVSEPVPMSGVRSTTNLEAMLHQEIIGMSSYDDSVMIMPEPVAERPEVLSLESPSFDDGGHDINASQDIDWDSDDRGAAAPTNHCQPLGYDDQQSFDGGLRLAHDDSDMLVIEDEMDLTRTDPGSKSEGAPRSVTIDFQSMLSRMRTGS